MNLKFFRVKEGLTRSDLADLLGLDRTTIVKWETGKSYPRADTLIKLADLFECTIDDLLRGTHAEIA